MSRGPNALVRRIANDAGRLYAAGLTYAEVADRLHVGDMTAYRAVALSGVQRRTRGDHKARTISDEDLCRTVAEFDRQGGHVGRTSAALGMPAESVRRRLRRAAVWDHRRGEPARRAWVLRRTGRPATGWRGPSAFVAVGPLLAWLDGQEHAGRTPEQIAAACDLEPRVIRRIRVQERVSVDLAERILIAHGMHLDDLYADLPIVARRTPLEEPHP